MSISIRRLFDQRNKGAIRYSFALVGHTYKRKVSNMSSSKETPLELSNLVKGIPENIWVRSVNLVRQYNPINLGQGFPDFPEVVSDKLRAALIATQAPGATVNFNQYCRGQGHPDLVSALADLYSPLYKRDIDPMKEILVTVGGYESLHCAINAVTNPGDEVVLIEPFFDSYGETVRACGAKARYIPLTLKAGGKTSGDFTFDREVLAGLFNEKTKAIVVNTPHNPTGKVFTRDEVEFIADLCKKHNCLYISDEVYEWLVYDDREHVRAATLPGMWERTITVCSAGKTFNVTGWKTGWAIGPEYLISAAMGVHQGIIYTCPTPIQVALATVLKDEKKLLGTEHSYWKWLRDNLTLKRDRMYKMASEAGLHPIMPEGGYFMVADASKAGINPPTPEENMQFDQRFVEWMVKEKGIAAIPVSAFFSPDSKKLNDHFIRFCFIKGDDTLDAAEEKFKALKN